MNRDSIFTVSPGLSFAESAAPGFGLAKWARSVRAGRGDFRSLLHSDALPP
jgi:hypothetical protein